MPDILPLLKSLPAFADFDEAALAALANGAGFHHIGAGVTLYRAGDRPDRLLIVRAGLISLVSGEDDRAAAVEFVGPSGFLGAAAVLLDQPCVTSAYTMTPAEFVSLPAARLRGVVAAEPRLAAARLSVLSQKCRSFMRQVAGLKRRSASQRLGCYILELARHQGGGPIVVLPCEKRTLSSFLGMTPEHLSRAFNTLRQNGVRTGHSRTVEITDRAKLELYAAPDRIADEEEEAAAPAAAVPPPRPATAIGDLPTPLAPAAAEWRGTGSTVPLS
jgi:CRP/FNR family transcriptional regulator, transcriptional activator FtrB